MVNGCLTNCLLVGATRCPNRLLERMKEFETEAILLAGPFNDLARGQHHSAHPMAALGLLALVDEQQPGLQDTPQLRPGLECATHLLGDNRSVNLSTSFTSFIYSP